MQSSKNNHTKEKRLLYEKYLQSYLSVIVHTPFNPIVIIEPFAGQGIDDDGERGSAIIAAETIKEFRDNLKLKGKEKNIFLFLNELNGKKFKTLKENLSQYSEFTHFYNQEGEEFIDIITQALKKVSSYHSLVFIDPFGYTQYSQENMKNLLNLYGADYIIFMPTTHIYRFMRGEDNPAREFVLDLGITHDMLNDVNNIDTFAETLVTNFQRIAGSNYVYSYKLENKDSKNTIHHLFFISKHIRGAEKFLETKKKIMNSELSLLRFVDIPDGEVKKFLDAILDNKLTNAKLYEESIVRGFLSSDVNPILKEMEKNGAISITADFKRRKGDFYLSDNPKTTIYIQKN